jgi:hypothetical protein
MRLRLVPARVAPPPTQPNQPPNSRSPSVPPAPPPPTASPRFPPPPRPPFTAFDRGAMSDWGFGAGDGCEQNSPARFVFKIGFQSFNVRAYSCCRQALAMTGCVAVPWRRACFMCKACGIVYRCVCCVCCCGVCLLLSYSCFVSLVLLFL